MSRGINIIRYISVFLCLLAVNDTVQAETRVALVIGIQDYDEITKLKNPVLDASKVAKLLRDHNFTVIDKYDLLRADLLTVLEEFEVKSMQADVAIIYYAGHGMAAGEKNLIAPKDMKIDCETRKAIREVEVAELFAAVSGAQHQAVILDACRNDPFPGCDRGQDAVGFREIVATHRSGGRKLLIVNSTSSEGKAADGKPGEHSPFAKSFLEIAKNNPNLNLSDLFDSVSEKVVSLTDNRQVPTVLTSGGSPRICLNTVCEHRVNVVGADQTSDAAVCNDAAGHWKAIENAANKAGFQEHLRRFGGCAFAALARARLAKIAPELAVIPESKAEIPQEDLIQSCDGSLLSAKDCSSNSESILPSKLDENAYIDFAKKDSQLSERLVIFKEQNGLTWKKYKNYRFGQEFTYPVELFTPGEPPVNDDGLGFVSDDGATISIYGSFNILNLNPRNYEKELYSDEKITYRAKKKDWVVLSGFRGTNIFYHKAIFVCDGANIINFHIEYPSNARTTYDPLIGRLASSLKASEGRDTEGCSF